MICISRHHPLNNLHLLFFCLFFFLHLSFILSFPSFNYDAIYDDYYSFIYFIIYFLSCCCCCCCWCVVFACFFFFALILYSNSKTQRLMTQNVSHFFFNNNKYRKANGGVTFFFLFFFFLNTCGIPFAYIYLTLVLRIFFFPPWVLLLSIHKNTQYDCWILPSLFFFLFFIKMEVHCSPLFRIHMKCSSSLNHRLPLFCFFF